MNKKTEDSKEMSGADLRGALSDELSKYCLVSNRTDCCAERVCFNLKMLRFVLKIIVLFFQLQNKECIANRCSRVCHITHCKGPSKLS